MKIRKILVSALLAIIIGLAALISPAGASAAQPGWRWRHHHRYYYRHWHHRHRYWWHGRWYWR